MEEVDQIKTRVVGVDIREVKTTYALVDIRGEIIAMDYFMTMDYPDVSEFVTALSEKFECPQRQLHDRLYRECRQYAVEGCRSLGCDVARPSRTGRGAG